jgi:signal transduction histidine kinase
VYDDHIGDQRQERRSPARAKQGSPAPAFGARDVALLHEVAVRANEADVARGVLEFALDRIMKAQGWDVSHAYLLGRHPTPRYLPSPSLWRSADSAHWRRFRARTRRGRYAPGEGMVGAVAESREARWLADVRAASPPIRPGYEPSNVGSGLLVPVVSGWESMPVAVLEFYARRRRRESDLAVKLVESAGAMLARVFEREQVERQLAESREREQRRIGRELHDTISQDLTGITLMGERIAEELEDERSRFAAKLRTLVGHISRSRARVHALSRGLLPVEIESSEMDTALLYLAQSAREVHGVECRVRCDPDIDVGDGTVAKHLVHIAQESIQNAVKHSGADRIDVELTRRGRRVRLTVTDDGKGFSPRRQAAGVGLRLMRHRAGAIGGEFAVTSRPGRGTRVRCECEI